MDFWECILPGLTHVCSRQSLNKEDSKKTKKKLQILSSECASHQSLEELHKENLLLSLGGGNKIQFLPVLGRFCSKMIYREQRFLLFQQGNVGISKEK